MRQVQVHMQRKHSKSSIYFFSESARVPRLDIASSTPDRWGTGDYRGKTKQTCYLAVDEIIAPKESNLPPKSFLQ